MRTQSEHGKESQNERKGKAVPVAHKRFP